jgi:hypothetical protein
MEIFLIFIMEFYALNCEQCVLFDVGWERLQKQTISNRLLRR